MSNMGSYLAGISDTLSSLGVDKHLDKMKNYVYNYTPVEAKIRDATSLESWGPTGTQMNEIAQMTYNYQEFQEIMDVLWKRMHEKHWRHVYKSLLLLDNLIRNGSERVIDNARDHVYELRSLESFRYTDENKKDQGINVRQKAKDVRALLQDDERLRDERTKAKRNRGKFTGVSASDMRGGGGYSGSSGADSSRYGGFENFGRSSSGNPDSSRYGGFENFGRSSAYSGSSSSSRSGGRDLSRYCDDFDDDHSSSRKRDEDDYGTRSKGARDSKYDDDDDYRPRDSARGSSSRSRDDDYGSSRHSKRDDRDRRSPSRSPSPPRARSSRRDKDQSPPRTRRADAGKSRSTRDPVRRQGSGKTVSLGASENLAGDRDRDRRTNDDDFGDFAGGFQGDHGESNDFGDFASFESGPAPAVNSAAPASTTGLGDLNMGLASMSLGAPLPTLPTMMPTGMPAPAAPMTATMQMGGMNMGMGMRMGMGMGVGVGGGVAPMGGAMGMPMGATMPMAGVPAATMGGMGGMMGTGMQPSGVDYSSLAMATGASGAAPRPQGARPVARPPASGGGGGLVNLDAAALSPANTKAHGPTLGDLQDKSTAQVHPSNLRYTPSTGAAQQPQPQQAWPF